MALDLRSGTHGAVTAHAVEVDGRPVVQIEVGPSGKLGALSNADGQKLAAAVTHAIETRRPLLVHVASTGALVSDGVAASFGWGLAARQLVRASGVVPLLFAVDGPAVSGVALLLGLADQVVVVESGYAFVTGPRIVREITGVPIATATLGGADVLHRHAGLASCVVPDRAEVDATLADLLSYLPDHCDQLPGLRPTDDPHDRATAEAGDLVPASPTGSYDVREVIRTLVDDGELLELHDGWAPNLVTGLATLSGRPVGLVANQPTRLAGTLDIPASQKGARFVAFCDAFNLPLVTLVDTPG